MKELRLEINKACNYRCIHCYTDKREHFELDSATIVEVLSDAAAGGATDLSLTGGEPLLEWKRVRTTAIAARDAGLKVRINTNGHYLTAEVVAALAPWIDEFQVSLNGASALTFDAFVQRHGAFDAVVAGLRRLVRAGAFTTIRYTATAANAHELTDTFRLVETIGVQGFKVRVLVPIGAAAAMETEQTGAIRESLEQLIAAVEGSAVSVRINDGGLSLPLPPLPNLQFLSCLCGADALFVDAEGEVFPCPFLRESSTFRLGNVLETPLPAIAGESNVLRAFIGTKAAGCGNEQAHGCRATDYARWQLTDQPAEVIQERAE